MGNGDGCGPNRTETDMVRSGQSNGPPRRQDGEGDHQPMDTTVPAPEHMTPAVGNIQPLHKMAAEGGMEVDEEKTEMDMRHSKGGPLPQPRAENEIDIQKPILVHPSDLTIPEFCYNSKVNFDSKSGIAESVQTITGLMNAAGGLLTFCGNQRTNRATLDKWLRDFDQRLQNTLPLLVYYFSVHCELVDSDPQKIHVFVKPYKELVTFDYLMYTRVRSQNTKVIDPYMAAKLITESSVPRRFPRLPQPLVYKSEIPFSEWSHIEFKHYQNLTTAKGIFDKITITTAKLCLFSFPNLPMGGRLFIGIEENEKKKSIAVMGQPLDQSEEGDFTAMMSRFFTTSVNGEGRIWNSEGKKPEQGVDLDWNVYYHEVEGCPSGQRRVVIEIDVSHYPGGVFLRKPQCYSTKKDGSMSEYSFEHWKESILRYASSNTNQPQVNHSPIHPPSQSQITQNPNTKPLSQVEEISESNQPQIVSHDAAQTLRFRESLSWSKDNDDWKGRLVLGHETVEETVQQLTDIFRMTHPLRFIPDENTIVNIKEKYSEKVKEYIREVKRTHSNKKGLVIGHRQWLKNILDSDIPERPPYHLLDIFSLDESCHMTFTTVVSESNNEEDKSEQMTYLYETARQIKFLVLTHPKYKSHQGQTITIQAQLRVCTETQAEDDINEHYGVLMKSSECQTEGKSLQQMCQEAFKPDTKSSELVSKEVQQTLALLFLHQKTFLKREVAGECLVQLTVEQMNAVLGDNLIQFNLIEGPPGCGKTYLILYLMTKELDDAVIAVHNPRLQEYYHFQRVNRTTVVKNVDDLKELFRRQHFTCLIFDDGHNINLSQTEWNQLFEEALKRKIKIFVFMDNYIQHFDRSQGRSVRAAFDKFKSRYPGLRYQDRPLSTNHRNSQKVLSFIAAESYPDYTDDIRCAHNYEGDDVEIRKLQHLKSTGEDNDLIGLLRELTDQSKQMEGNISTYDAKDIVVLVDGKDAEVDVMFYRDLLNGYFPTQGKGNIFPTTGIIVEHVDNYGGLEANVVVWVNSDGGNDDGSERQLTNKNYKAFVASRAIHRVVFVTQSSINLQTANVMNINPSTIPNHESGECCFDIPNVPVVGMMHYGSELKVGDYYQVTPTPDNPHDKFAVAVVDSRHQIRAHMMREWAERIHPVLTSGVVLTSKAVIQIKESSREIRAEKGPEQKGVVRLACKEKDKNELTQKLRATTIRFVRTH